MARTSSLVVATVAAALSFCVAGCGPNGGAGASADDVAALKARLQKMEDEKQIRDAIVQYGQYLDSKDFEHYAALFTKDGEWTGLLGELTTVKGADNIRAAMEKAFAERVYDPAHITNLHLISNVKVDVDGDRATAYSKWTVLSRNDKNEPYPRVTGHYDDVFVREEGNWKFASRVAKRAIP